MPDPSKEKHIPQVDLTLELRNAQLFTPSRYSSSQKWMTGQASGQDRFYAFLTHYDSEAASAFAEIIARKTALLAEHKVLVPAVYGFDLEDRCIVYQHIKGPTLAEAWNSMSPIRKKEVLRDLFDVAMRLNEIETHYRCTLDLRGWCERIFVPESMEYVSFYQDVLSPVTSSPVALVHGDYNATNIIIGETPYLIDLVSVGAGPRSLDLAALLVDPQLNLNASDIFEFIEELPPERRAELKALCMLEMSRKSVVLREIANSTMKHEFLQLALSCEQRLPKMSNILYGSEPCWLKCLFANNSAH